MDHVSLKSCTKLSTRSPRRGVGDHHRGPPRLFHRPQFLSTTMFLSTTFLSTTIHPVRKDSHV
ncbi:hypothetical protein ACIQVO_10795 [Streptomyces sp. NPDC101062]|uniref:hypothetical protein n=1 Tax=unclassified Streptomyces TaxID=2593676 RepID=UPI00381B6903